MELHHVLESQQFTEEPGRLEELFAIADRMKIVWQKGGMPLLRGCRAINLFHQPSTRTHCSFSRAEDYLGIKIVYDSEAAGQFSSFSKGESDRDAAVIYGNYDHRAGQLMIVLRHPHENAGYDYAQFAPQAHVFNAGCGKSHGQHPTQSFGDILTILAERPRFREYKKVVITCNGDNCNGRTVRSLAFLAPKVFPQVEFVFVSPQSLRMRPDILDHLRRHGIPYTEVTDPKVFPEVLASTHVLYMTRFQKEDLVGEDAQRFAEYQLMFQLNPDTLRHLHPDALIMHPLPRNKEITVEIDDDPRAVYLRKQTLNGLWGRMALAFRTMVRHSSWPIWRELRLRLA